jgi:pilus assembly protein Flp/PilA
MLAIIDRVRTRLAAGNDDEEGQGILEYGLILSFVALLVVAALLALGPKVANVFTTLANSI